MLHNSLKSQCLQSMVLKVQEKAPSETVSK